MKEKIIISYKPQHITYRDDIDVKSFLYNNIRHAMNTPIFIQEVINKLEINKLYNLTVKSLSGGEQQLLSIVITLGKPVDIYLLDEPSANLDAEMRLLVAKVIKRFIFQTQKSAYIVEHDIILLSYLADKVIIFEGQPGIKCKVSEPYDAKKGINKFLKILGVTIRRDHINYRPRINKYDSVKDREQKNENKFFI